MVRFLPTAVLLFSLLSYSYPQMPSMSTQTPRIGQAIELAHFLFHLEDQGPSVRKECRLLSSTELDTLFDALRAAKEDTTATPNMYDLFAFLHSHPEVNPGAHGGTGFLPFHRVYIYLFERLLRYYEPTVSLCYWDTTLEPEDYRDSAMWTADLFGSPRGLVEGGFATRWITPIGPLLREVGGSVGRTLTEQDIDNVLSKERIGQISFPNGRMTDNLEELHNHVHLFVGGLMSRIESAAYDPIFWFHHAFLDCLYDEFRHNQGNATSGINPERDWPEDFGEEPNAPFSPMRLGALRNIDGANNFFSERIRCERMPACRSDRDCGRFMNCDTRNRRCISNTIRSSSINNGGMFGMGTNTLGGMFQNGQFNMQRGFQLGGGNQGFNPFSQAVQGMFGTQPNVPGMPTMGGGQSRFQGMTNAGFPGGQQGFGFPGMTGGMGGMQGFPGMGGQFSFPGMQGGMAGMQGGMRGMQGGMQGMQGFPGFGK